MNKPDRSKKERPISPEEKLLSDNIFEHMRIVRDATLATRNYFMRKSPVERAIRDDLNAHPRRIDLIGEVPEASIRIYRGTGAGISFKVPRIEYSQIREVPRSEGGPYQRYELDYYILDFTVGYENEEENHEFERLYSFQVPFDLELNFTREKYDAWVAEQKAKREAEKMKEDLEKLKELVGRHPEWGITLKNVIQLEKAT
jgi:hypothetical protein